MKDLGDTRVEELTEVEFHYILDQSSYEKQRTPSGWRYMTRDSVLYELHEPDGRISYWEQCKGKVNG